MSTLSKLYGCVGRELDPATTKFESLGIDVNLDQAARLYLRLRGLGTYSDTEKTPPAVNGFDLALKTTLILVGKEQSMLYPSFDGEVMEEKPRPFNILVGKDLDERDKQLTRALQRGYRLGLYILCRSSPYIEYIDSNVGLGTKKTIARHNDSNRIITGQHINQQQINTTDIGYGAGVYPSNASRVYSYSIEHETKK
jgi:hypothetical protein